MNNKRKTTEEFILDARKVHGDKYDYSKVKYVNSHTKVCIICPIHGEFWQTPTNHLWGKGCKKCANEYQKKGKRLSKEQFIEKAINIHGNRYDYSLVDYKDSHTKVKIICPIHGVFEQSPNFHLSGGKCPKCATKERSDKRTLGKDEFILKSKEIYGDKYDYSLANYINKSTKIKIICPEHGVFSQTPSNHLKGYGCPKCRKEKKKSKICGIGINDLDFPINNNEETMIAYKRWEHMLTRCYSDKYHKTRRSYVGCSVCEYWVLFSKFKEWFDKNYVKGWALDKDLLVKGNKIYSPQTCCFVPYEINSFLANKPSTNRTLPTGVVWHKDKKKYIASMGCGEKTKELGAYDNVQDAREIYIKAREKRAKDLAYKYKESLDERAYNALINYKED